MSLEILTAEEQAVLDAVIMQRYLASEDIFRYDIREAQKYLIGSNAMKECTMDGKRHSEILKKLSDKHIIDLDYMIEVEPNNSLKALFNGDILHAEYELAAPIIPYTKPERKIFWARQTDWAYDYFQKSNWLSIEEVYAKIGSEYYIKMTLEDIDSIKECYKANHRVWLDVNKTFSCIRIRFDREKRWRQLFTMDSEKSPFMILEYAHNNQGEPISRDELYRKNIADVRKKSLKTQVFSDNSTVQTLIPLLIKMNSDSIMFEKEPVRITLSKLNELKVKLKLI